MIFGVEDICLGRIGHSETFCLKTGCKIKHQKYGFQEGSLSPGDVVVMKNANVAFTNPVLKNKLVTGNVWESWKNFLSRWYKAGSNPSS